MMARSGSGPNAPSSVRRALRDTFERVTSRVESRRAIVAVALLGAALLGGCRKRSVPVDGGADGAPLPRAVAPVGSVKWTLSPPKHAALASARLLAPEVIEHMKHVAYSPDGRYVAATSGDDAIVWERASRTRVAHLPSGAHLVEALAWSSDSAHLALLLLDEVRVFDLRAAEDRRLVAGYKMATTTRNEQLVGGRWAADRNELAIATSDGALVTLAIAGDAADPASGARVARRVNVASAAVGERIVSAAWSPDLTRAVVVTAMASKHTLVDGATGAAVRTLAAPAELPLTLSFDPGGKRVLVVYNGDASVYVLDLDSAAEIAKIATGEVRLEGAAWSPDGARVAAAGFGGFVRMLDVAAAREIGSLGPLPERIEDVAWSPDGKELASGGGAATLWDVERRAVTHRWLPPIVPDALACSADGRILATHTAGFGLAVLQRDRGELVVPPNQIGPRGATRAKALTLVSSPSQVPEIHVVAAGGVIGRWNAMTLAPAPNVVAVDYAGLENEHLLPSPNGRFVAALVPPKSKKESGTSDAGASSASPLAAEWLVVWSVETGAIVARGSGALAVDRASTAAWSPRSDMLAVTTSAGDVAVVDATTGARVRDLKVTMPTIAPEDRALMGSPIVNVAFSADGASVLTTSFEAPDAGLHGRVGADLWSVATGEKRSHLTNAALTATTHALPGGKWLANGGTILDMTTGEGVDVNKSTAPRADVDPGPYAPSHVWAYGLVKPCSPADGSWVAFAASDGVVIVRPSGAWLHLARVPFGDGFATLATTREGRFDVVPEQALPLVALLHRGRRVPATELVSLRTRGLASSWLSAK